MRHILHTGTRTLLPLVFDVYHGLRYGVRHTGSTVSAGHTLVTFALPSFLRTPRWTLRLDTRRLHCSLRTPPTFTPHGAFGYSPTSYFHSHALSLDPIAPHLSPGSCYAHFFFRCTHFGFTVFSHVPLQFGELGLLRSTHTTPRHRYCRTFHWFAIFIHACGPPRHAACRCRYCWTLSPDTSGLPGRGSGLGCWIISTVSWFLHGLILVYKSYTGHARLRSWALCFLHQTPDTRLHAFTPGFTLATHSSFTYTSV